jgi:hypothetical protein
MAKGRVAGIAGASCLSLVALGWAASVAFAQPKPLAPATHTRTVVSPNPPPAPSIVRHPVDPTSATAAEFTFADLDKRASYQCSLDGGAVAPCTGDSDHDGNPKVAGEIQYSGLTPGSHCFSVVAIDVIGRSSSATQDCWTIVTTFTISGDLTRPLYPGTSQSLNLTISNPNPVSITIMAGRIQVAFSTNQAGCSASTNFTVVHGLRASVTVPARTAASLAALGIPKSKWPVVSMVETHTDQDACRGATLTLTYSGSAS